MVTWVLQNDQPDRWSTSNEAITKRCDETGHKWELMQIVPFERSVIGGDPIIEGPVVAYGSTGIDTVVERNKWAPGVWRVDGVIESHSKAALGDLYMNTEMQVVPVREAATVAAEKGWEFFFVKPDSDNKEFAGTVTDGGKYPFFIEGMLAYDWIDQDFNVCVSPIKQIGIEWRLPVVDGKVVDYSIYRQWREVMPKREIYQEVLDVAAEAISRHNPAPVYVIDIGQVDDELKVIEYNGFNSAGLYDCNIANVVDAINEYVDRTYV
jgi:hypothetical protein